MIALKSSKYSNADSSLCRLWGGFVGSPIQKQSLKFFFLEECINGGKMTVPSLCCQINHSYAVRMFGCSLELYKDIY